MSKEASAAKKMLGDFASKLVELMDNVLFGMFGRVWSFRSVTGAWRL